MQVQVTSDNSYARKIAITVPADRVRSELDKAFKKVAGRARLPGFRKGKAPRKVIEAQFGPQVVEDVANALINEAYRDALSKHELIPVSQPSLVDSSPIKASADFAFTVAVDVRPEVELTAYTGFEVYKPEANITDEQVSEAIERRRKSAARLASVEDRAVQAGDKVQTELLLREGEDEVANEPGTLIDTDGDFWYPGVESLLTGLEIGGEASGEIAFADDARNPAIKGRTLQASVKVLAIQAMVEPELDDALAEELGFEGGVEGMKAKIREDLGKGREESVTNVARANLLQKLIEANDFEVPEGMINQNLQMLMEEVKLQQAYQGVDPRNVRFTKEQVEDLRGRAAFAAKGGLILEAIQKKEGFEVTDEDVEAKYAELAEARGQSIEAIKGYFVQDDAVDDLRARILEEKTLDWLLAQCTITNEPPKAAEAEAEAEEAPAPAAEDASDEG